MFTHEPTLGLCEGKMEKQGEDSVVEHFCFCY